jgi:hypothetical protein
MVTPESRQVVFINQVLPHDINVGFQDIRGSIVTRVNGRPVGDMKELVATLQAPVGGYHVVEIDDISDSGTMVVIDAGKTEAANAEIMKRFGVPADRSEDLR